MNLFKSTSRHQENLDSRDHAVAKGWKLAFTASLIAIFCLAFSPAWADDYLHAKAPAAPIHLTSLSIIIGPGGVHLGNGTIFYGRGYPRPHVHVVPVPRRYWNRSRHHGHHQHYAAPQRFNRGHGWKNEASRGHFRGKNGRGNAGHRGGHR